MNSLEFVARKAAEARRRLSSALPEPRESRKFFIPGYHEKYRALPNPLARSSIFSSVARGKKEQCESVVLVSRSDAVISFTGEQLDESQADLWIQLIFEARAYPLGDVISVNRAKLLRSLGKNTSGANYVWLARAMAALANARFSIRTTKQGVLKYQLEGANAVELISQCGYDTDRQCYTFLLSRAWATLFSNSEYALIDWEKRLRIRRGQDMAKALQLLIATSNEDTQRYPLEWLQPKLVYRGRLADFRDALLAAMSELERVEITVNSRIERGKNGKELAVFTKIGESS